jgi:hypothetical protein
VFLWKLSGGVRPVGQAPRGAEAVVEVSDGARASSAVECTVTDRRGRSDSAVARFSPLSVRAVVPQRSTITIDGSGLGAKRGPKDAVYLLAGGRAIEADSGCPAASWSDTRIVACLPRALWGARAARVRVQSGARLVSAPGAPLALFSPR